MLLGKTSNELNNLQVIEITIPPFSDQLKRYLKQPNGIQQLLLGGEISSGSCDNV